MDISIVIPVFNEEENIIPLYKDIIQVIKKKYSYEILFIDDGSYDNTLEEIKKLEKKVNKVSFPKNYFLAGMATFVTEFLRKKQLYWVVNLKFY